MAAVLVFGITLLVAVFVSGLAQRSSLVSTAAVFLLGGVMGHLTGVLVYSATSGPVSETASLALFAVLFTDGMKAGLEDLQGAWRAPGRLLLIGLPLAMMGYAVASHLLVGLDWKHALLLGAVLSPTDPVFAQAIVGREEVPGRVRHLLNVESGLNDGLALPLVLVLTDINVEEPTAATRLVAELAGGLLIGLAVPLAASLVRRVASASPSATYVPLGAVATALIILATTRLVGANEYVAAFAAGSAIATVAPRLREEFEVFGELLAELLKLAALLAFGALLTPALLSGIGFGGWGFVILALFFIRPMSVTLAMIGRRVPNTELATVAWFGPKGFASAIYAIIVLRAGVSQADVLFNLAAVTVAVSIILHSSTDVPIARFFARAGELNDEVDDLPPTTDGPAPAEAPPTPPGDDRSGNRPV
ncbi:MAG: cation:proton antiporter [Acidimicrobiales bacterium]